MMVRVKFFCTCDAYVDDVVDPDFEPIEHPGKQDIQISFRHAVCENCGKAHEISLYYFHEDKFLALADNDVEDFKYEMV